jgi:hypothetical protein
VGNGHFVVVQDNDQVLVVVRVSGLVQSFVGQAGGERPVPDDRHHLGGVLLQPFGAGNAQAGRDGCAAVAGGKGVVWAFTAFGKAGQAAMAAQGREAGRGGR